MAVGDVIAGAAITDRYGFGVATPARTVEVGGTVRVSGSDAAYTTASWSRHFESTQGAALMWRKGSASYSRGLGCTGSDNKMHFFRSTADDNSAAATYDMVIDGSGHVGIGTTSPAASALLDLSSTTGALLVPRMTTAQRDALTAVDGMVIYNTTTTVLECREAGAWVNL